MPAPLPLPSSPDAFAWQLLPDGGAVVRLPPCGRPFDAPLAEALAGWRAAGVPSAFTLLPTDDVTSPPGLAARGFRRITVLEFHRHGLAPTEVPAAGVNDLRYVPVAQLDPALVVGTIDRTYVGTLDAPELNGTRRDTRPPDDAAWAALAFRGAEPVGVLVLDAPSGGPPDEAGGRWEVSYLGVVPEARRTGVGAALVRAAVGLAGAAGRRALHLSVDERNHPAKALYRRSGFRLCGRQAAWLWINAHPV